jgi:primosomal protein N' (replication factor Y) (superfamily II helicase)
VTIEKGHQAILLLNRRGYSNFVFCSSCQEAIQCKYCDTTMTYHRTAGMRPEHLTTAQGVHTGQLHCHYCLAVNPLPATCPACEKKLSLFGLGTQRVEEELTRKFPDLKYARVDSDSMRGKGDYEKTLGQFARREIQVMLGTQMIAKGLDFPNVTLVGVVDADVGINLPDFRASERCFQLLSQVAGRAGRGPRGGEVLIQTRVPTHHAVVCAVKHDYAGFVRQELESRVSPPYPPTIRLANIVFSGTTEAETAKLAASGVTWLHALARKRSIGGVSIIGPAPCPIERIKNRWRWHALLKSERPAELTNVGRYFMERFKVPKHADLRVTLDRDPVALL